MPRSRSPRNRKSKSPGRHGDRSKSPKHRNHKKHHQRRGSNPSSAPPSGPGKYHTLYWDDLPNRAMRKAKMLGYNERKWDEDRPVPIFRKKPFVELSKKEKKACIFLGMDIFKEHRDLNQYWDHLVQEIKDHAIKLGYDQHKWDNDEDPEADDMEWEALSEDQKTGAKFFGYGRNAWSDFADVNAETAVDSDDDAAEEEEDWVEMEKEEAVQAEEISNEQEVTEDTPAPEPAVEVAEPVAVATPVMSSVVSEEEIKPKYFMTRLYGGEGGSAFDHLNRRRISEVTIRGGKWVDGICVEYANGDVMNHGGDGGGPQSMELAEDEYINAVRLKEGNLVQSLTFYTNKGNHLGPVGNGKGGLFAKEGTHVEVKAPEGYRLIGIRGREGTYLDAIGFRWGPVPARMD